jgi:tetratricopeptide (TPR) repeat protein
MKAAANITPAIAHPSSTDSSGGANVLVRYTAAVVRACLAAIGLSVCLPGAAAAQARAVTFARDVAPIIAAHCLNCHRAGGDAPFSLQTYDEVRRRAPTMVAVTRQRYMPPWKPEPGFGEFKYANRLSVAQVDLLAGWVDAGMPPGDAGDAPIDARASDPWPLGRPDLVVALPAYQLRPGGADVFRNFVVAVPPSAARYVRGLQFRAGNTAVHHANIRIDPTPASRRLDEADGAPGYEGIILRSADFPDGHFLGWTPGQIVPALSDAVAWRLDAGSDLVVQLHLRPTGRIETIAPVIGLYLTATPPAAPPSIVRLGRQDLDIPAGAADHRVNDRFVLPVDAEFRAVLAHAHYGARAVQAWAALPDGSRRELLRITEWDPAWQDRYEYAAPFWLPAGTIVHLSYVFDNSAANVRNRQQPPARAGWGWRTSDEMGDLWIQVMTRSDQDREVFRNAARLKMQTADAIGCETLIEREPNRIDLRNDAAAIYMSLDQPVNAMRHFAAATRLDPASAAAWFNQGVALEAMGDAAAATHHYEQALRLNPGYSAAHNNLGTLLLKGGRMDEASRAYEQAVRANPGNAEAHANLGLMRIGQGQPDAAIVEVDQALRLQPERAARLVQFVWLLAANPSAPLRRPDDAGRIAARIVEATGRRDARALDALGIAGAARGRFADAEGAARAALDLATAAADHALAAEIRGRLALYARQQPFVLPR